MLQVNPQLVPSQVDIPLVGVEQGVHAVVPHELGLMFGWQVPLQSCVPLGQTPAHDALLAMQAPAHSFIPDGQVPPHDVPSQVAPPPVGTLHAVQDDPHDDTAVLSTHEVPQAW